MEVIIDGMQNLTINAIKQKTNKKCPENKELNPKTNRCVKKCKENQIRDSNTFKCKTRKSNTTKRVMRKTNKMKVDEIFKPDKNGVSEWKTIDEIKEGGLKWTTNGNQRHGKFFGVKDYMWEPHREKKRIITKLRLIGFDDSVKYNRPIRKDIEKYHKKTIGACIVCGSKSDLVTDHKNDLYNDPRVLVEKTQKIDDFQCLCNHCNLQKKQVSIKTKQSKKRYKATNIPQLKMFGIDFIEGDEDYDPKDINAMVGTYWYDPIKFMEFIKQSKGD